MVTSLSYGGLRALEAVLGRRMLWRAGRLIYQYARRDGRNDPATNGEYALHRKLAQFARAQRKLLRVIDIGGFTGYWSLHLLETCQDMGVDNVELWTFEPSEESRTRLADRLKLAPPRYRVSIRSEAVADVCGSGAFDSSSAIVGAQRLLTETSPGASNMPHVQVPVTTLAAFFSQEGIDEADYVKSDAEGYDLKVVQGALPLLRERRIGLLQFEYNHCWVGTRSLLFNLFDLAAGARYRVCKVVPNGLESYPAWHPELETFFDANFALVREDLAEPLGVREGRFDFHNTYAAP